MGSFSDYWEEKILNHLFGHLVYNMPVIYIALSTADPLDDGSGMAEPVGNAYERRETTEDDWDAAAVIDGKMTIDNAGELAFLEATGSWGTISHFALFDAAAAGNMLAHGALEAAKAIGDGDTARFKAGDLAITLD